MKKKVYGEQYGYRFEIHGHNENNTHRRDEMPKNKPSKLISINCPNADYLCDAPNFGGHKRKKGGRRMVSGIVRSKLKRQTQKDIENNGEGLL